MQRYSDTITTQTGDALIVLASATVYVYNAGTTVKAPIFSDNAGASLANPITSSSTGRISFYAADGRYDLVVAKAGFASVTIPDILLEDPDNTDDDITGVNVTNCVITGGTITGATISGGTIAASTTVLGMTAAEIAFTPTLPLTTNTVQAAMDELARGAAAGFADYGLITDPVE